MARIMSNAELTNNMANHEDRITKLEKESKSMAKVNINIETGKGMSPADLYISIKNGDITLDDFCVIAGLDVEKVKKSLNKIEKDGYIHNKKLDGVHVCSQMMRAMAYNPKGYHKGVDGYTEYVKSLSYHEQFRFLKEELDRVAHMEKQGDTEYEVHKHFFTQDVVLALFTDYVAKLREYVQKLVNDESQKCKGKRYIKLQRHIFPMKVCNIHVGENVMFNLYGQTKVGRVNSIRWNSYVVRSGSGVYNVENVTPFKKRMCNMVFVEDIDELIFKPLKEIILDLTLTNLDHIGLFYKVVEFIDHMPVHFIVKERKYIGYRYYTVPYDKCPEWVDAYKKRGAYMTANNLIKFHGCKLRGCSTKETLAMLENKAKTDYGWEILGFLREVMRDSNYTPQTFTNEMFAKYHR